MRSYQIVKKQIHNLLINSPHKTKQILSVQENQTFKIIFNRPQSSNAFSLEMYVYLTQLIYKANNIPQIKFIVITGAGGNFSTGNDLRNFTDERMFPYAQLQKEYVPKYIAEMLQNLGIAFIQSKKPIFGIVQGKTLGFAFTQLALYDKVFAVRGSEFMAPLVLLAQGPEMCSSYTFPKIFGKKLGYQLIFEGKRVEGQLLQKYQFLQIYQTKQSAQNALLKQFQKINNLEWNSYIKARQLFGDPQRELLKQVNKKQCLNLIDRWMNPDIVEHLMKYLQTAKSQSKKKPKL